MTVLEAKRWVMNASNEDSTHPLFKNRLQHLQKEARDLRASILRFNWFHHNSSRHTNSNINTTNLTDAPMGGELLNHVPISDVLLPHRDIVNPPSITSPISNHADNMNSYFKVIWNLLHPNMTLRTHIFSFILESVFDRVLITQPISFVVVLPTDSAHNSNLIYPPRILFELYGFLNSKWPIWP